MLWLIMCTDKPNQAQTREKLLAEHRNYLDTNADLIFFSGPQQTDDGAASLGSLFILNTETRKEAEDFINNETFCRAGVFEAVVVRRMRKGRFNPQRAD